jgi:hypothetical protein
MNEALNEKMVEDLGSCLSIDLLVDPGFTDGVSTPARQQRSQTLISIAAVP